MQGLWSDCDKNENREVEKGRIGWFRCILVDNPANIVMIAASDWKY
jgi:hypothetical protein